MISWFIVLLFIHYLTSNPNPEPKKSLTDATLNLKFFASIPTMIVSFAFHPSLFTAFDSLREKSTLNGLKAGWGAVLIAYITYSITPLLGFGLYGANVHANLLVDISLEEGTIPVILQIIFLVIAVVHIPIIFFIGKEALLRIVYAIIKAWSLKRLDMVGESNKDISDINSKDSEIQSNLLFEDRNCHLSSMTNSNHSNMIESEGNAPQWVDKPVQKAPNPKEYLNIHPVLYYFITITVFSVVVGLSIIVGDVSVFFGIIGSTVACWMILAGPGSFYIIAVHKHNVKMNTILLKLSYLFAWVLTLIGFSGMIVFNIWVITNAIRD